MECYTGHQHTSTPTPQFYTGEVIRDRFRTGPQRKPRQKHRMYFYNLTVKPMIEQKSIKGQAKL